MPQYLVEKDGRRFQVEADSPEQADADVAEMLGSAPASEMTGPVRGKPMSMGDSLGRLGQVAVAGAKRAPMAFAEGAGSLMLDLASSPMMPGSMFSPQLAEQKQRFREAVRANRAEDESEGPAGTVLAGDVIAGLIPFGSAFKAQKSEKLLQAVRRAAGEGAVAANLSYTEGDRATQTVMGSALPAAFRAFKATPGAIMNVLSRRVLRRSDPVTAQLAKQAQDAFTSPVSGQALPGADDYTLAQSTGDPRIARFTSASADTTARDVVRKQLDQRVANVQRVSDELGGTAGVQQLPERAKAMYKVVDETDVQMARANSGLYKSSMDKLAASPEGKAIRVPLKPLADEMQALEQEFGNLLTVVGKSGSGTRLLEVVDTLKTFTRADPNAALNVNGLRKLQEGINAGRLYGQAVVDPDEARLNAIRGRLQGALARSIEQGPSDPGYQQLRGIAREYAERSDQRRRLADDALTTLFGDKSVLADPEAAFDRFINLNPEAQRMGVALLSSRSPAQLGYMRKRYLDRVLDQATRDPKPGMVSTLDAEKLVEGLTSKQMTESPLFTAAERGWAAAAAKDLRVILNSLPDTTKVGKDITLEDFSINVISRSPEFMTRFAVRAASGLGLEDLLFSQRGRNALSTVSNLRTAPQTARERAAAYFIGLLAREDQQQPEEEVEQ